MSTSRQRRAQCPQAKLPRSVSIFSWRTLTRQLYLCASEQNVICLLVGPFIQRSHNYIFPNSPTNQSSSADLHRSQYKPFLRICLDDLLCGKGYDFLETQSDDIGPSKNEPLSSPQFRRERTRRCLIPKWMLADKHQSEQNTDAPARGNNQGSSDSDGNCGSDVSLSQGLLRRAFTYPSIQVPRPCKYRAELLSRVLGYPTILVMRNKP